MPELAAAYFGAMRAGLIYVPLDLRMSVEAIENIVSAAETRHLHPRHGPRCAGPQEAGLEHFPTTDPRSPRAPSPPTTTPFPPDWEAPGRPGSRPTPDDVFQLVFTSGTTGTPKGVMLAHDNILASIESFHRGHAAPGAPDRVAPAAVHLLEQAVGLFYALSVGADVLYVRSRNPRVIFDALRDHRVTSMVVVPQVLDLFWSAMTREVEKRGKTPTFDRLRGIARHLPMGVRRRLFGASTASSAATSACSLSAGAFLPPALQQGWEDLGVIVMQGYGATETGTGTCTTLKDHGLGTVGRPPGRHRDAPRSRRRSPVQGPAALQGLLEDPEATAAAFTEDGWYKTGDIGHFDHRGPPDPVRPDEGHHRAAERLQRVSRGHRERPADRRIRDSVVLETKPGRIEAIVLGPASGPRCR